VGWGGKIQKIHIISKMKLQIENLSVSYLHRPKASILEGRLLIDISDESWKNRGVKIFNFVDFR
jgi:hypothetical protein